VDILLISSLWSKKFRSIAGSKAQMIFVMQHKMSPQQNVSEVIPVTDFDPQY
jgi:hypothetical protein